MPSEASADEYPIDASAADASMAIELGPIFERMRDDLLRVAGDFLAGDVQTFRRVRAVQSRERAVYVINRPDGHGGYVASVDPASAQLKERFGRDDGS